MTSTDPTAADRTTELTRPPNLTLLFAKGALAGLRKGSAGASAALPAGGYTRSDVRISVPRLAEYARVCGFGLSDRLPVTCPHILAFPLQTKLMTDDAFPFPLVGLVHIANRITQLRPIRVAEPLELAVRADHLRGHDRGRQFDLNTEVFAAGELVWTETSTYLRRERSAAASSATRSGATAPGRPVAEETPAAVWRVPGDTGRRYAQVSGDHNPIHLHALSARPFGFTRAIAHGMWSLARCVAFLDVRLPDAYTVDVRFKLPIGLPGTVALTVEPGEGAAGWRFALSGAKSGKPHLAGSIEPVIESDIQPASEPATETASESA